MERKFKPTKDETKKPHYSLGELLAQCDADAPVSHEDRAWLDSAPMGREII